MFKSSQKQAVIKPGSQDVARLATQSVVAIKYMLKQRYERAETREYTVNSKRHRRE
jgi:hypothetical protein